MNILNQHIIGEDNKCCGKNCPNSGSILLKINYVNKKGYFCNSCSGKLLNEGLAIRLENNSSTDQGSNINE